MSSTILYVPPCRTSWCFGDKCQAVLLRRTNAAHQRNSSVFCARRSSGLATDDCGPQSRLWSIRCLSERLEQNGILRRKSRTRFRLENRDETKCAAVEALSPELDSSP